MIYFKGKIVGEAKYLHRSAIELLDPNEQELVQHACHYVANDFDWNVIKIDLKDKNKVSFLNYEDFEDCEFPALLQSCQVSAKTGETHPRNYSADNPPILHRKELLLPPNNINSEKYRALTLELEELGAFSNSIKIGTKKNWEKELHALGIAVRNHSVLSLEEASNLKSPERKISRHRTAISRGSLSLPAKLLFTSGVANEDDTYLDYGCGRGDDIKFLNELGIPAKGWDPYFTPDEDLLTKSDVVNLGFVLNVIERPEERIEVLKKAFSLANKCFCVAVMLHSQNNAAHAMPHSDGHLTSINTFQKFYEQQELEAFLTKHLKVPLIAGAPGVFLVFKNEAAEQDFLLKRQLGIVQHYEPKELTSKVKEKREANKLVLNVVNNLAKHILTFARKPALEELPRYFRQKLEKSGLSYQKAFNGATKLISDQDLEKAVARKKEQLELFFAMYLFSGRPKYGDLSPALQKDVKLHFGSVKTVEATAKELLFSFGNEELILRKAADASQKKLGVLDEAKFTFLCSKFAELPIHLRGIVNIAERLAGNIDEANIIRIHIDSKKVSYLCVEEIDRNALPKIASRTIVNLRNQSVKRFTHTDIGYEKVLYQKSKFMVGNEKNFRAQKFFDDLVAKELDFDFSGEGPKYQDFQLALTKKNITPPSYV